MQRRSPEQTYLASGLLAMSDRTPDDIGDVEDTIALLGSRPHFYVSNPSNPAGRLARLRCSFVTAVKRWHAEF